MVNIVSAAADIWADEVSALRELGFRDADELHHTAAAEVEERVAVTTDATRVGLAAQIDARPLDGWSAAVRKMPRDLLSASSRE